MLEKNTIRIYDRSSHLESLTNGIADAKDHSGMNTTVISHVDDVASRHHEATREDERSYGSNMASRAVSLLQCNADHKQDDGRKTTFTIQKRDQQKANGR